MAPARADHVYCCRGVEEMANWWTEMWTSGSGRARTYCGIARTEDGFAVDLFRGDNCLDSWVYPTREAAVRAALDLQRQHAGRLPAEAMRMAVPAGRQRPRLVAH